MPSSSRVRGLAHHHYTTGLADDDRWHHPASSCRKSRLRSVRPSIAAMAVLATATLAICVAILYRWTRSDAAHRGDRLFLKYLASFGFSCASLCLAQYLMVVLFVKGSEYAVKKYAFGLDTTLFLLAAYGITILVHKQVALPLYRRLIPLICFAMVPFLFIIDPQFRPSHRTIDAIQLTNVERLLRYYHDLVLDTRSGKSNYAIGIAAVGPTGDYLLSIVPLHAPRLPNALAVIWRQPFPKPEQVGFIFTSEHSSPWDVPSCRLHSFPNRVIQLDGACVLAAVGMGSE
jgi:hypothetical protein